MVNSQTAAAAAVKPLLAVPAQFPKTISGWIGVDLDGTLARYDGWHSDGRVGDPIAPMVARVKEWLKEGCEVRIVTARVAASERVHPSGSRDSAAFALNQRVIINEWCEQHIGQKLPLTASKDFAMLELWDDRAVQCVPNTGQPVVPYTPMLL